MSTKIKPWYKKTAALAAQFAVGDTVLFVEFDDVFTGTAWVEPMTVVQIIDNHPLHAPIYARNSEGVEGGFDPATLRKIA